MSSEGDYEAADKAIMNKWARKKAAMENADEEARADMKELIKNAMKNEETRTNLIREVTAARRSDAPPRRHREGYGEDNDVITGFRDDCPWTRD